MKEIITLQVIKKYQGIIQSGEIRGTFGQTGRKWLGGHSRRDVAMHMSHSARASLGLAKNKWSFF
jgi:hypothetical protein